MVFLLLSSSLTIPIKYDIVFMHFNHHPCNGMKNFTEGLLHIYHLKIYGMIKQKFNLTILSRPIMSSVSE